MSKYMFMEVMKKDMLKQMKNANKYNPMHELPLMRTAKRRRPF